VRDVWVVMSVSDHQIRSISGYKRKQRSIHVQERQTLFTRNPDLYYLEEEPMKKRRTPKTVHVP
jgi:hypothetical protein